MKMELSRTRNFVRVANVPRGIFIAPKDRSPLLYVLREQHFVRQWVALKERTSGRISEMFYMASTWRLPTFTVELSITTIDGPTKWHPQHRADLIAMYLDNIAGPLGIRDDQYPEIINRVLCLQKEGLNVDDGRLIRGYKVRS